MNAIVLSFDRLPVTFLGCYGNGWVQTPAFDRLAAQSVVFDQHYAENVIGGSFADAWWSGRYECRRRRPLTGDSNLISILRNSGITVRVLDETSAERESELPPYLVADCRESVCGTEGLDVDSDETPMLRLVARAHRELRWLTTSRKEPWLLWLRSRGVPTPWLPPRKFASQYLDLSADEDADIPVSREPDEDLVDLSPAEFDELLQSASVPADQVGARARSSSAKMLATLCRRVFAGYVSLLDVGLGQLLPHIEQAMSTSETLGIVTAARGGTIHQSSVLIEDSEPLSDENVRTPLLIRIPGLVRGVRRQSLVQTVDIASTLLEWFGLAVAGTDFEGSSLWPVIQGNADQVRAHAFTGAGPTSAGIRRHDFYLVKGRATDRESHGLSRLFAKPEDVWDMNDVALHFPGVVEELSSDLDRFFSEEVDQWDG
jgi:arylsulfatase A-like enzyme